MRTTGGSLTVLLVLAGAAAGSVSWSRYHNDRYGYTIDLPPGFSMVKESDNSDGGASSSAQGHAELGIWGASLINGSFRADARERIHDATNEGWDVSYRQVTEKSATWSGAKGGRILYAHSIPMCTDQAAYFQIEYDQTTLVAYDAVIKRLVKTLRSRPCL